MTKTDEDYQDDGRHIDFVPVSRIDFEYRASPKKRRRKFYMWEAVGHSHFVKMCMSCRVTKFLWSFRNRKAPDICNACKRVYNEKEKT